MRGPGPRGRPSRGNVTVTVQAVTTMLSVLCLASVAKKTLLTRIPRLVYHHHAQRKDEPTGVPAHEIVAMFRKRLVRRAAVGVKAGPIAKLFLEVTQELA